MNFRCALLALLASVAAAAPRADASACDDLAALDWLQGAWRAETASRIVTEHWWPVSPDTLEGAGRSLTREHGTQTGSEHLRLVEMGGAVYYLAKVNENALPVAFRLTDCAPGFARFENPQHDFPRRLDYRLTPAEAGEADVLTVHVSAGESDGYVLQFERVATPPDSPATVERNVSVEAEPQSTGPE